MTRAIEEAREEIIKNKVKNSAERIKQLGNLTAAIAQHIMNSVEGTKKGETALLIIALEECARIFREDYPRESEVANKYKQYLKVSYSVQTKERS